MNFKKSLLIAALAATSVSAFAQMPPPHGDRGGPGLHEPEFDHREMPPPEMDRHGPSDDRLEHEFAVREIVKKLHQQRMHVEHLLRTGRLTLGEADRLRAADDRIEHRMHEMREHHRGHITPEDVRELDHALHEVHEQLHD